MNGRVKTCLKNLLAMFMAIVLVFGVLGVDALTARAETEVPIDETEEELIPNGTEPEEEEEEEQEEPEESDEDDDDDDEPEDTPDTPAVQEAFVILAFNPFPFSDPAYPETHYIVVDMGTEERDIPFPSALRATVYGGEEDDFIVSVSSWVCVGVLDEFDVLQEGGFDPFVSGIYRFEPVLYGIDVDFVLADDVSLPVIDVIVTMGIDIMPLSSAAVLVNQINSSFGHTSPYGPLPNGLSAMISATDPNVINVTGSITNLQSPTLNLNIDQNVTVNWNATFSGARNGSYILNLTNSGTFNLTGEISNKGTGGTVNVTGEGASVAILNGGSISSYESGIALNIAAGDVTANIPLGGSVISSDANSAISVTAGVTGVRINVVGGLVSSYPSGYAITDGGTALRENNTQINVTDGGTVRAGSACAIRSTGSGSVVTVINGMVSNNASSNSNPVIYMNGGLGDNVIIGGSSIIKTENPSTTSYVIQTTGNVRITDNAQVLAIAGRAINLVGMNSVADIIGGIVSTDTGIAICTATTDPGTVVYSSVRITGGWVRAAETGTAIRTTGSNSVVSIEGGRVTARQGHAVQTADTVVNISGGFVFAYGTSIEGTAAPYANYVIHPASGDVNFSGAGIAVAWANPGGEPQYYEGDDTHLAIYPAPSGTNSVLWHNNGIEGGIHFANGSNIGFFPLANVIFTPADYGPHPRRQLCILPAVI